MMPAGEADPDTETFELEYKKIREREEFQSHDRATRNAELDSLWAEIEEAEAKIQAERDKIPSRRACVNPEEEEEEPPPYGPGPEPWASNQCTVVPSPVPRSTVSAGWETPVARQTPFNVPMWPRARAWNQENQNVQWRGPFQNAVEKSTVLTYKDKDSGELNLMQDEFKLPPMYPPARSWEVEDAILIKVVEQFGATNRTVDLLVKVLREDWGEECPFATAEGLRAALKARLLWLGRPVYPTEAELAAGTYPPGKGPLDTMKPCLFCWRCDCELHCNPEPPLHKLKGPEPQHRKEGQAPCGPNCFLLPEDPPSGPAVRPPSPSGTPRSPINLADSDDEDAPPPAVASTSAAPHSAAGGSAAGGAVSGSRPPGGEEVLTREELMRQGGWDFLERSNFENMAQLFPDDPCTIAMAVPPKTCREVHRLLMAPKQQPEAAAPNPVNPAEEEEEEEEEEEASSQEEAPLDIEPSKAATKKRKAIKAARQAGQNAVLNQHRRKLEIKAQQPCWRPCSCAPACSPATCPCVTNGMFCDKRCGCFSLKDPCAFVGGCRCEGPCNSRVCPCRSTKRECDPVLCLRCKPGAQGCKCTNMDLRLGHHKRLSIQPSKLPDAGWGVVVLDDCKRGDCLGEYTGEILSRDESKRRSAAYDRGGCSYIFMLNAEEDLDATQCGSALRYANHADPGNCQPEVRMVDGEQHIGLFASQDIPAGSEVVYNYGYSSDMVDHITYSFANQPASSNGRGRGRGRGR